MGEGWLIAMLATVGVIGLWAGYGALRLATEPGVGLARTAPLAALWVGATALGAFGSVMAFLLLVN